MSINFLIKILKTFFRLFGKDKALLISSTIAERIIPTIDIDTKYGIINFYSLGQIPAWRAQTLLLKEPETIEWIEGFNKDELFWDVGANIGVYSLYAAKKGNNVLSFEPMSANYFLLNKNIESNKLSGKIKAFCLAFNDETILNSLNMSNTSLGSAHSTFLEDVDQYGKNFTPAFKQAMLGFNIDGFIEQFSPEFPNHIKIDVDGIEDKIIYGARNTLSDARLKTLLIELDPTRVNLSERMVKYLNMCGLFGGICEHPGAYGSNAIFIRNSDVKV
jgi:FkbM family methyltransferase